MFWAFVCARKSGCFVGGGWWCPASRCSVSGRGLGPAFVLSGRATPHPSPLPKGARGWSGLGRPFVLSWRSCPSHWPSPCWDGDGQGCPSLWPSPCWDRDGRGLVPAICVVLEGCPSLWPSPCWGRDGRGLVRPFVLFWRVAPRSGLLPVGIGMVGGWSRPFVLSGGPAPHPSPLPGGARGLSVLAFGPLLKRSDALARSAYKQRLSVPTGNPSLSESNACRGFALSVVTRCKRFPERGSARRLAGRSP